MLPKVYVYGDAETFRNYKHAVEASGGLPCFGARPEECDALLLPGGGDMEPWRYGQENVACFDLEPERDAAELALLDLFTGWKKPILGICRGMQTINVFFGGTLVQDIPGHSQINGIDRIHAVHAADPCGIPDFTRKLYGSECLVNSAHHQCVDRLGAGLCVSQQVPDGIVEAFYHQSLPVWGIQWHPERLMDPLSAQATVDGGALYRFFVEQI